MDYSYIQGNKYLIGIPIISSEKLDVIAQHFSISKTLASVLLAREIDGIQKIKDYFHTSYEKDVHDPRLMKDAIKAVDRISIAIERQEKILIFGDYDVDGITSSSLMMIGLLALGAKVNFYLPNRVKDGYGLSSKIVKKAAENNYSLIITVDNGITAFAPVELAKELGVDVIITDHHQPHDHIPDAYAVVDPHQHDCTYPFKYFAGVGVAFKILTLLFEKKGHQIPDKMIELLLFGTVADVVPLTGENRYWVRVGLNHINRTDSYCLQVLKTNSKVLKPELFSTDIGFSITPQINALGRLDDPRQGVQFLLGQNLDEVDRVGKILFELNQARKQIEKQIIDEIVQRVESGKIDLSKNIVVAASDNWPAGVIGLVASRIVGLYGKPTLLFHITSDGLVKGSCRSIQEFNIFQALEKSKDLLIAFGGHSHAAGLSLKIEKLPELEKRLQQEVIEKLTEFDLKQKLKIDSLATLSDFSDTMMEQLRLFEPFGHENPQPYFYIKNVVLVQQPFLLKDLHVKCRVFADGVLKSIMFFNRPELFNQMIEQGDQPFDVVAQVLHNYWNGSYTIELQGIDVIGLKD
ncbi:single-stranded-DNA-specific exonuclease RecJ [Candidatus Dependentiae bacterium]|nr:single-stranded-DNA-specific exonuclease RecJ [Candidatus Dependentiae bacterium]